MPSGRRSTVSLRSWRGSTTRPSPALRIPQGGRSPTCCRTSAPAPRSTPDGWPTPLAGREPSDERNEQVWAAWDAKTPRQKVDDAVAANAAFVDQLAQVTTRRAGPLRAGPRAVAPGLGGVPRPPGQRARGPRMGCRRRARPRQRCWRPTASPWCSTGSSGSPPSQRDPSGPARTITLATSDPEQSFAIEIGATEVTVHRGRPHPAGRLPDAGGVVRTARLRPPRRRPHLARGRRCRRPARPAPGGLHRSLADLTYPAEQ